MAGKVPIPNMAIYSAPELAEPDTAAQLSALYTSPQGSQPHNIPARNKLGVVTVPCRRRVANGCNLRHKGSPKRSIWRKPNHHCPKYKPNATNTNAAKRSEEHTSELQSRENLVCRLLLEKKKEE